MLQDVLTKAEKGVVDQIGGFLILSQKRDEILFAFVENMNAFFDELMDKAVKKPGPVYDFETLSLVNDADLEIIVALDGMVNAARNVQLPLFISFNTRLNSLVDNKRIDESTNPLDPSQIADAFKNAIAPLKLDAQNSLSVYRRFNTEILRNLEPVLNEANKLLVESGVLPQMGVDGGRKPKPTARLARRQEPISGFGTIEEDPYDPGADESPELFSMMQNLLHGDSKAPPRPGADPRSRVDPGGPGGPVGGYSGHHGGGGAEETSQYAVPASFFSAAGIPQSGFRPFVPAAGEQVQMVDQAQLIAILTNIQKVLEERSTTPAGASDADAVEKLDISSQLGEMLKESQPEGVVNAVDRQSSDIINLVTMLYEAIWQDESVPIPIKELIGRTQVTIIKVALSDTTFFNKENHPARAVINEFAEAGVGWTEADDLDEDPLYQEIQSLVTRVLTDYTSEVSFFEEILADFRAFRAREAEKSRELEQRILKAKERQEQLEDIHELVTQKINDRILGRDLNPILREMLDQPFHKFMVMLVLKEGPGTNAWKQAINTIDVLLWTVQPHEHEGDRQRLESVNPRLINNLRKAFRIAQLNADEIDATIRQLTEVQQSTFDIEKEKLADARKAQQTQIKPEVEVQTPKQTEDAGSPIEFVSDAAGTEPADGALNEDDPHVKAVDKLHVGIWVEFTGAEDITIRCKLAAKINAIDKYIFVNRQGIKVVEKTRMGLATELRDGTVKIISDGLLFSRALESVIGNLRVAQQVQHTGSAFQPGREQRLA